MKAKLIRCGDSSWGVEFHKHKAIVDIGYFRLIIFDRYYIFGGYQ